MQIAILIPTPNKMATNFIITLGCLYNFLSVSIRIVSFYGKFGPDSTGNLLNSEKNNFRLQPCYGFSFSLTHKQLIEQGAPGTVAVAPRREANKTNDSRIPFNNRHYPAICNNLCSCRSPGRD